MVIIGSVPLDDVQFETLPDTPALDNQSVR